MSFSVKPYIYYYFKLYLIDNNRFPDKLAHLIIEENNLRAVDAMSNTRCTNLKIRCLHFRNLHVTHSLLQISHLKDIYKKFRQDFFIFFTNVI